MLELFDTHPDCNVQEAEYKRLLGYPARHHLEGRAREIAEASRQWYAEHGRPWIYARQAEALELSGSQIRINGAGFSSPPLHEQFHTAQVHSARAAGRERRPAMRRKSARLLAGRKAGRVFLHGNVRLGGGGAFGRRRQRPPLRLGGPTRDGRRCPITVRVIRGGMSASKPNCGT